MKNDMNYEKSRMRRKVAVTIKYFILIGWSVTTIFPFLWTINNSFRDNDQIYGHPFSMPTRWRFDNYSVVWTSADVGRNFFNSLLYSTISTALTLLLAAMTAYVLARVVNSLALYTYFILGIMIPIHAVIIPLFVSIRTLGLMNTRWALMLAYTVGHLSFSIFVLVGFMKGIPKELEESALIDGCGRARTFFSIILPVSKPGLATVGTFAYLGCWNDFLLGLLFAVSPHLRTLNLACFNLRGLYVSEQGLISAGLVVLIVPVTIMYILFQEQVIKGLTAGAVKG